MKRLLASLMLFSLSTWGCAKPAASPSANPVQNVSSARDALTAAGYKCKTAPETKRSIICQQDEPRVKFIFGFEEMPARMVIVLVFTYPTICDPQRLLRMNLFNGRVDYAHASCEGKNIFYFGSQNVPVNGLTSKDVVDYVQWWTKATIQAGAAAGLFDEGESAPSPSEGSGGAKT
ncbi:MAG: hypothetical protein ACXVEF_02465 [Polyangiales bacterium]